MSFAAEGDGEVSPHILLSLEVIVEDLRYAWLLGSDLRLTLHDETLRYQCDRRQDIARCTLQLNTDSSTALALKFVYD